MDRLSIADVKRILRNICKLKLESIKRVLIISEALDLLKKRKHDLGSWTRIHAHIIVEALNSDPIP